MLKCKKSSEQKIWFPSLFTNINQNQLFIANLPLPYNALYTIIYAASRLFEHRSKYSFPIWYTILNCFMYLTHLLGLLMYGKSFRDAGKFKAFSRALSVLKYNIDFIWRCTKEPMNTDDYKIALMSKFKFRVNIPWYNTITQKML